MIGDAGAGVKDFSLMLSDDGGEVIGQRLLPVLIEEESNRYSERVRDFLQRADRGRGHSSFDLADETGRHSDSLGKHLQRHPTVLSHLSDLQAD